MGSLRIQKTLQSRDFEETLNPHVLVKKLFRDTIVDSRRRRELEMGERKCPTP